MEYMEHIKYHPLVDADTDGSVKVPTFCSTDARAMQKQSMYLEEMIPNRFRLCTTKAVPGKNLNALEIYCPSCGAKLRAISPQNDGERHALYLCDRCASDRVGRSKSL